MAACLLACEASEPNGGAGSEPKPRPREEVPTASTPKPAATTSSSSAAPTTAGDDNGPPWVRGLRQGCTKDDDCMKVRACVTYAIRRDAHETFKERIRGTRFRCERIEDAGAPVETRAACVDGTCKIVTMQPKD